MILTQLKDYADTQMSLPPPMYTETKVRWLIAISSDGKLESFIPRGGDSKINKRGEPMVTPHVGRTVGVKPKLLADTGEYVLGIARPDSTKPERVQDCHQQFKLLVQKCAEATQEPTLQPIIKFLASWNPEQDREKLPPGFDASDVITFSVGEVIPADARAELHEVQSFWASYTAGGTDEESDSPMMTCLVTGKEAAVVQRMPLLIKGLIGGQPSGTALVSANSAPFTSYGLQNSLTSPISRDAAERFTKALNHLIAGSNSKRNIGATTYVVWTREKTGFNPLSYLDQPDPQAVINLLNSPITGQQTHATQAEPFYALALTASNARAVVRSWLETTIPAVKLSLQNWFIAQKIVDAYGEPGRPLSVFLLAVSAYREASEMLPTVPTALVRVALEGGRLPDDLLVRAVRRNRVEREISYYRAALIKLILITQEKLPMTEMQMLDSNPHLKGDDRAAYYCGRLLAQLEAIQRAAIRGVNASLTDRYYGAASSTPALAFPPLMRGSRAHLSKLRKNTPGTCNALEEKLEEIISNLGDFPKTLKLQQQGLFALGYYHERAADRAAAKAAKATKAED